MLLAEHTIQCFKGWGGSGGSRGPERGMAGHVLGAFGQADQSPARRARLLIGFEGSGDGVGYRSLSTCISAC